MSDSMTALQLSFSQYIKEYNGGLFLNEPLSEHCSFKIGGEAEILFVPHDEKALAAALEYAEIHSAPLHILGNGSNVLISDEGLSGIVLQLMNGLCDIIYLGDSVIGCAAGVSLKRLCSFALEHSLSGLEFAYGIPGSVGGAVYMNAGAYGGEIKDVLMSVRSISRNGAQLCEEKAEELDLSYRNTPFMKNGRIITAAYFRLTPDNPENIRAKMNGLMEKRRSSQPLQYPSAGSVFKRPETGYAAAFIDQCGLKGLSVGSAQVSEKHAGFIVNRGGATFKDVSELMKKIQNEVLARHGVRLEPEIEILKD